MLSREAVNTNVIVFGMTQPGLDPMIYHIRAIIPPMQLILYCFLSIN